MSIRNHEKLRDLGNLEKYSSTRHALGLYNNVSMTAYYSKAGATHPLRPIIYQAVAKVIQQHPVLSAIPVDEDLPIAHFVRLPSINLEDAIIFVERRQPYDNQARDVDLDDVLEQQHNQDFKLRLGKLPFWRLVILSTPSDETSFAASFFFHHSIADGQSGLAFHQSFYSALLAIDTESALSIELQNVVQSPRTSLIPSLEQLHPLPLTVWFILSALWGSIFPSSNEKMWTSKAIDFSYQKRRIRTLVIPAKDTSALLVAARAHDASLTGVVPVLLSIAMFTKLDAERWQTLKASVPISLRGILPKDVVDSESMGTFVSQASVEYERQSLLPPGEDGHATDRIWEAAKRTKLALTAAVARRGKNDVLGLLRWAGPLKAFFEQRNGTQPAISFEFSNVGVFRYAKEPSDGDWKVGRLEFGQDGNVVGPAVQASGATGPDGALTVSFAWMDEQVEEEWILEVMKGFEEAVSQLLTSP